MQMTTRPSHTVARTGNMSSSPEGCWCVQGTAVVNMFNFKTDTNLTCQYGAIFYIFTFFFILVTHVCLGEEFILIFVSLFLSSVGQK